MKKQARIVVIIFLFPFWNIGINRSLAQSLSLEVVGSSGTYATSQYGSMAWTIGEVMTETYPSSEHYFTQGFHQPDTKLLETEVLDFFIPEGFSPNGDGINDLFVIRGAYRYPRNSFTIFNRWGNKVFQASPYKNKWDGKCKTELQVGGDDLPVGTYFYLFDLGDGSTEFNGTIYLNR